MDLALAGSCLVELALVNRIQLASDEDDHRKGRVVVRDSTRSGDDVLDGVLEALDADPAKRPEAAHREGDRGLPPRGPNTGQARARAPLRASGCRRPQIREHEDLGIRPRKAWPTADSRPEAADWRRVITHTLDVLRRRRPHGRSDRAPACAARRASDRRHAPARAGESSESSSGAGRENGAGHAVRKAVDEILAAVIAATTAAPPTVVLPRASRPATMRQPDVGAMFSRTRCRH